MLAFIQQDWALILAALLAVDKVIALSPLGSNSLVQLLGSVLQALSPTTKS